MKRRISILFLLVAMLAPSAVVLAYNPAAGSSDLVWRRKPNRRTGLYTVGNSSVRNGLTLSVNGLYYYGDNDARGIALSDGFKSNNLSISGSLAFAYVMPQSRISNWRFSLNVGKLRGDNSDIRPTNYRKFSSWFGEIAAGIEVYPIRKAGFYIYAGIGVNLGNRKYEFVRGGKQFANTVTVAKGEHFTFAPVIPIEIGYDFRLTKSWGLRLSLSAHQAVVDAPHVNMDGYPMSPSEDAGGIGFGRGGGNKWADGYFQIGLSVSYNWHNCEKCRLYED
ncbi:MAG: hypothetical protein IJS73_05075 [Paludibacteraceae bacterium]|nr:hypothetical protein [Paludibacteraceae bacterium]